MKLIFALLLHVIKTVVAIMIIPGSVELLVLNLRVIPFLLADEDFLQFSVSCWFPMFL